MEHAVASSHCGPWVAKAEEVAEAASQVGEWEWEFLGSCCCCFV